MRGRGSVGRVSPAGPEGQMGVRLYRIILPVDDIDCAAQFYSGILGLPGVRVSPGRHYFDCGGTILACYDPPADGDSLDERWRLHENQFVYFSVPDLESAFRRAQELECPKMDQQISSMPWGERLFYAQDPFGNPICFVDEGTVFTGQ